MTIQGLLNRLLLVAMIPFIMVLTYTVVQDFYSENILIRGKAVNGLKNAAIVFEQHIQQDISALKILAASPELKGPLPTAHFYQHALGAKKNINAQIVVVDTSNKMVLNTRVPFGTKLPPSPVPKGVSAVQIVLKTNMAAVGDTFIGPYVNSPLFAVAVPVHQEDELKFIVLGVKEAKNLQELMQSIILPNNWQIVLRDSIGRVLASNGGDASGIVLVREDAKHIEPIHQTPWMIELHIPVFAYYGPAIKIIVSLILASLAAASLAFFGGKKITQRLVRELQALVTLIPPKKDKGEVEEIKDVQALLLKSKQDMETALLGTLSTLANVMEKRDPYTAGHERRVGEMARAIGQEMGLEEKRIRGLELIGMMHDIGKIAIPAEILSSPGRLSKAEFMLVQEHAQAGYDIVKDVDFPWPVAKTVLQHHERFDGSGYPQGLKGDDTLLEARIISVADVVEAMSSHRPYRPGLGIEAALAEIESNSGTLYDPEITAACLRLFREKDYSIPV